MMSDSVFISRKGRKERKDCKTVENFRSDIFCLSSFALSASLLLGSLSKGASKAPSEHPENLGKQRGKAADSSHTVQGYKMEKIQKSEKHPDPKKSSGVQWFASVFVLLIVGLFAAGIRAQIDKR